ncbi:uncharacterized protein [Primulina eburnea]|uniref:uncharacterized protein n=1 Tax=Primulina eburnea TaxID=1245227 RepID=UPI003C6C9E39
MATRKDDSLQSISVQLDRKNYSYWGYVMKNFLRGKSMWGYVTSVRDKPTDQTNPDYAVSLDVWEADNSKIITWINNSVAHSIESAELRAFSPYIARREEQRLVQFLMALQNDFEGLRGTILHRNPLPSVDSVVSELLAEEIRLKSHIDTGTILTTPSVFAAPQRPQANHQNRSNTKVSQDECAFCKEKGHWKAQCPLLLSKGKVQSQQQQQRPHNIPWKPQQQH